jgi:hypothetical protein
VFNSTPYSCSEFGLNDVVEDVGEEEEEDAEEVEDEEETDCAESVEEEEVWIEVVEVEGVGAEGSDEVKEAEGRTAGSPPRLAADGSESAK